VPSSFRVLRRPSDVRRQQLAIAFVAVTRLSSLVIFGTAMAVFIGREATPLAVALALTAYHLGSLLFAPVWGAVADITGRRRGVLLVTTVFASLAVLPLAVSRSVPFQIGIRALYAVFAAGYAPAMLAIVSEQKDTAERGRAVGFYNSVVSVGGIGGRVVVGVLLGLLVPPSLYLTVAGINLLSVAGILALADPTPTPEQTPPVREFAGEVRSRLLPGVDGLDHLRENGLQWLYLALVLRNTTQKGIGSVIPVFLTAGVGVGVGVDEFTMGLLLAVSPTLRTVLMYAFGALTDRVGRKPLITTGLVGAGVQALLLATAVVPDGLPVRVGVATLGFIVHAVTFSALSTGTIAFIGDVAHSDRESELMGLRTTTRGIGGVVGPVVVGSLATVWSYQAAFALASGLAFVAAVVVVSGVVESHTETVAA
jgi:DHA1 family multidrug resistance protein-like MFS transporter